MVDCLCCLTIVTKQLTYDKLCWFLIVWWTFWDHCQLFYPFDLCRAKNLTFDLFFNNYETVLRRYHKLYFFWIVIIRGICWYGSRQHWSNFWIWPMYKLSCDPQASCTWCDPAAIWHSDPWIHTNIMKLSYLSFLFSWLNFASVWPIWGQIWFYNVCKSIWSWKQATLIVRELPCLMTKNICYLIHITPILYSASFSFDRRKTL